MNLLFNLNPSLDSKVFTEDEFVKISENYPSDSLLLVSPAQKQACCNWSGNSVRWIDVSGGFGYPFEGWSSDKDMLVYSAPSGDYRIVTAREVEQFHKTKKKLFGGKKLKLSFK